MKKLFSLVLLLLCNVAAAQLFIGTYNGELNSIDPHTGKVNWTIEGLIGGGIPTKKPLLYGYEVIIPYQNRVYSLDAASGKEVWRFQTKLSSPIELGAVLSGHLMYVTSEDGYLYCLRANTGEVAWKFYYEGRMGVLPIVFGDRILFAHSYHVYILGKDSGSLISKVKVTDGLIHSIALSDNKEALFIGTSSELISLNIRTLKSNWTFKPKPTVGSTDFWSNAVSKDGIVFSGCSNNVVYALDEKNGSILWEVPTTGNLILSSPTLYKDLVILGSDSTTYFLKQTDGSLNWKFKSEDGVMNTTPVINKGTIFLCGGKRLYAVHLKTRKTLWEFNARSALFQPCLSEESQ